MNNNQEEPRVDKRPLALLIRSKRQWHGTRPMTQAELANRAGVTVRQLKYYESCRELPAAVAALRRIAAGLDLQIEDLIPEWTRAGRDGE